MTNDVLIDSTRQIPAMRALCEYSEQERRIMKLDREVIQNQLEKLQLNGKSPIFENQEITASEIVREIRNRKIINVMVVSRTQSGKTGSMCATVRKYLEDDGNLIPTENIYIITGLSSCEWKEQTRERMPESVQKRVFHRAELPNTFADEIKDKKNILIIMDEIQVAAKKGQTIYKAFEGGGLLDKEKLYENDVKILEYTATPGGTIYDLMKWNDASCKILAGVGDGYVSSFDLLKAGRVKQYKELCGRGKKCNKVDDKIFDNITEIKNDVDNYKEPLYHIIRTRNGSGQDLTIENFKRSFNDDNYVFLKHDVESEIEDINKTLSVKPNRHSFIFIKEKLRCSKTLKKTYIGILYDRCSNDPDDDTVIQGLLGRDTGYDNNGISICYTNVDSVERYEKLWESGFDNKNIKWRSKTTRYRGGVLSSKDTFNNPNHYGDFSETSDDNIEIEEPAINKFETQEQAKEYCVKVLGVRGPNKTNPNNSGYYEATIRSNKKVYSCAEVENERKSGLGDKKKNYRCYPCYRNARDKTTLEWWIVHKPVQSNVS